MAGTAHLMLIEAADRAAVTAFQRCFSAGSAERAFAL